MNIIIPKNFLADGWHIGIAKNTSKFDFGIIFSKVKSTSAVIFTKNNFVGWPIKIGREIQKLNKNFRAIVVNSGNANVANGNENFELAKRICKTVAKNLEIEEFEVLPASTGVIGRSLIPYENNLLKACNEIPVKLSEANFNNFANAICTTDAFLKIKSIELTNKIRILGIAKGAGMIEPNMATLLSFVCTDAAILKEDLQRIITSVSNKSFNRISVDSDTSTSDTFAIIANGSSNININFDKETFDLIEELSYPLNKEIIKEKTKLDEDSLTFYFSLLELCVDLACLIAQDGEGATKLVEVSVLQARSKEQALKVGRAVINSPLVKTAIYGADPNWGRILMAVGKVFDEKIDIDKLKIVFGEHEIFPVLENRNVKIENNIQNDNIENDNIENDNIKNNIEQLKNYLKQNNKIKLKIFLGQGTSQETLWGCDLTKDYVHLNSAYTS